MCVRIRITTHTIVIVGITHGDSKKLSSLSSLNHRVAIRLVPIAKRKITKRRIIGHDVNGVVRTIKVRIHIKRIVIPAAM